ncbi:MAG: SH3 domain-containing protein [SAR324 cluster bacterium]|nr:SH3 domain-containing protein [SAR324 cluster bacterium]MCZ6629066.1 SH3 domain-containing protein [SAR324 cluster bacterium]MCZ6729169.1 SH3 domain-containing protein [SAR324 cluster bacterium]
MNVRILKISGNSPTSRQRRLEQAQAWMERHGWRLMDYSEELGSAAFERDANASALGLFDPTRWLPGPGGLRPGGSLRALLASPRRLLFSLTVIVVVAAAFVLLLNYSQFKSSNAANAQQQGESWLYVSVESLNIRAEPKPNAQIVGAFYLNQRVLVTGRKKGWARVVKPEWGYVAARYLQEHPAQ